LSEATRAIVAHALGLRWEGIPEPARIAAATFLHDSLCVGTAGIRAAHADALFGVVASWGAPQNGCDARVLGRLGVRLPPCNAAFLNAFQIHGQEYDCVHEAAVVHPLATVAATLLSEVDRTPGCSGRDLLAALIVGVDIAAGLGVAATSPLRFFRPATAGIFGSVMALARLRGLDEAQATAALGYALAFASGTMQAHVEAKPALPIQVGAAARSAVQAVDIAAAGIPGVEAAIEGPFGYLALFEDMADIAPVLASLGRTFRICETSWKPFPTGRAAHGAIVATQLLRSDHGVNPATLDSLVVSAPPLIARLVGRPMIANMPASHARLCFAYLGAVTLLRGSVTLDDFTPARLGDAEVAALAARIKVIADDNPDPAAFVPATVTARLKDGREEQVLVETQLGSPEQPLTHGQHLEKARGCLAFAGLPDAAHATLTATIERLSALADARVLLDPLSGPLEQDGR
jgi:2-methylcitrate dehydratase PrpD